MMIDSYDYFSRCESCAYFKSYCYDEFMCGVIASNLVWGLSVDE